MLLLWSNLFSQQIITDRPDQTEASSTVPSGTLQIESGFLLAYPETNLQTQRSIFAPCILFRLGISRWIEFRVLSQLENRKYLFESMEISGISDLEIGTKVQLFKKEGGKSEVAFITHLLLPTGTRYLSNGKFGTLNRLLISHRITEEVSIGYNLGYNNFGSGNGDFIYTFSIAGSIGEKAGIFIEPYGEFLNLESHQANINAGFIYLPSDNLQADFSFGTGINHRMNFLSCGISYMINK